MMPVVRTETFRHPFSDRSFVANVVLDHLGRECVWVTDGYYLLKKNGTIGRRKTKQW